MEIKEKFLEEGSLVINDDFLGILEENGLLSPLAFWDLEDEPVKAEVPERRTGRFFLKKRGQGERVEFFIKKYRPLPVFSRLKGLFSLKWEHHDGLHEWRALVLFHKNMLPTLIPVAAGRAGRNTFCVTLGLKNYERASRLLDEGSRLSASERLSLIEKIGTYAARMHKKGFAHQDLYLLHFFVKLPDMVPFLIDLQRVVIQKNLRRRWAIKDIAQLLFSSRLVLSEKEIGLLLDSYCSEIGFDIRKDRRLFRDIEKKAAWMMKRHLRRNKEGA